MPRPQPAALALSSTVLRVLTKLNLLLGALILALLIVSLVADSWFREPSACRSPAPISCCSPACA